MTDSSAGTLLEIPGEQAFANVKQNPLSTWPHRDHEENRLEPIAKPGFDVPFKIQSGMPIFTIGSCFARNVENRLFELGFDIPARRIADYGNATPAVLNNYTTPSMFNEVNWALNPDTPFDPDIHLYRIGSKVVDMHLGGRWSHPTTLETALERRRQIDAIYKRLVDARVLILTMGFVEAWYDRELDLFLNSAPLKSLIEAYPGRFVVRVLRHREVYNYLARMLTLVREKNTANVQCLLTVSPVPIQNTFRKNTDIFVANAYSKATLRSVADEICTDFDFVHYYPSYESVTLSDRSIAWLDDNVHVKEELIATNISRMVAGYLEDDDDSITDPGILLQRAQNHFRQKAYDTSLGLVDRVLAEMPENPQAINLKTLCLQRSAGAAAALDFLAGTLSDTATPKEATESLGFDNALLLARLFLNVGKKRRAFQIARHCAEMKPNLLQPVILMGDAQMALGHMKKAVEIYTAALDVSNRVGNPYFKLAQAHDKMGDHDAAKRYADLATSINPTNQTFLAYRQQLADEEKARQGESAAEATKEVGGGGAG